MARAEVVQGAHAASSCHMLVRQNSPSARTNCVRQSNDFTDLGTLEANSWFIGSSLRAAPIAAGTPLAMTKRKRLPDWKTRSPDPCDSLACSIRGELRSSTTPPCDPQREADAPNRHAPWSTATASNFVLP